MVASARLAAGLSGLRNRNTRVTNKTQLHVLKGNIEADPIIPDDEDNEKNRILASQGVDEEDANEHHLQAALFASSQRTLCATHYKSSNSTNDPGSCIPTPDAAGIVAEYDTLYPAGQFKDSSTYLRFSDSLDESFVGGLAGGFTYFLDERDAEWLDRHNGAARGEGTSASGGVNGAQVSNGVSGSNSTPGVSRALHARCAKAKGKEPEQRPFNVTQSPSLDINENNFELVVGLFEKWTDESVSPYLHLSYDPEHFPQFVDYERLFSAPLTITAFANFVLPPNLPSPNELVRLAQAIYPWWRERRIEREGHRLVPQLNVLVLEAQEKEDKTSGSPYVCFRKRDVKPMRKTRTNNVTHVEKLARLRGELQTSLELAKMVLQREKLKSDCAVASGLVWHNREGLVDGMRRLDAVAPGSVPPADESLLFDKEHKPRKKVEMSPSGRIILTSRRLSQARAAFPESLDPHSPLALSGDTSHLFESRQKDPSGRVVAIQREVDEELIEARKVGLYWEDLIDIPQAPPPSSGVEKYFKDVLPASSETSTQPFPSSSLSAPGVSLHALRNPRSARLRVGRGGRLHFDRRLHISQPHRLFQRERAGHPLRMSDHVATREETERWAPRNWRPRQEAYKDFRVRPRNCQPGQEYLSRPSIYDNHDTEMGDEERTGNEMQNSGIEIEQNGLVWDDVGHSGLWARALADGDVEGRKPIPFSAADAGHGAETLARNALERDRLVEAWHGRNSDDGCEGGEPVMFMDCDATENDSRQDKTSQEPEEDKEVYEVDGRNVDVLERAWRIEDRWRYDVEGVQQDQDGDRFMLDDFQPKFMRTAITLLDAMDHDVISMDAQSLAPPPLKQNRYLDHQLRLQNPGLPKPSSSGSTSVTTQKPLPPRQMPTSSYPTVSQTPATNGAGVHAPLSISPATSSTPTTTGNHNGNGSPISSQSMPPPKLPNGTSIPGLVSSGARLPPDSFGAAVRVSTSLRTKNSPPNVPATSGGVNPALTPGDGDAVPHGPFQQRPTTTYSSLKTALGRVLGAQQETQQQGRTFQKTVTHNIDGANSDPASVDLNKPSLNLPSKLSQQLRTRVNGENRGANKTAAVDHYSRMQHLAFPHLPASGTHPS